MQKQSLPDLTVDTEKNKIKYFIIHTFLGKWGNKILWRMIITRDEFLWNLFYFIPV